MKLKYKFWMWIGKDKNKTSSNIVILTLSNRFLGAEKFVLLKCLQIMILLI